MHTPTLRLEHIHMTVYGPHEGQEREWITHHSDALESNEEDALQFVHANQMHKESGQGLRRWLSAIRTCKHEDLSLNLWHTHNKHMPVTSSCNLPWAEMGARHHSRNSMLLVHWETLSHGNKAKSSRGGYLKSCSELMSNSTLTFLHHTHQQKKS